MIQRREKVVVTTAIALWLCCSSIALAQRQESSSNASPNPLEITTPDPLLPRPNQPLSPQERQSLATALDQLNIQAQAQLAAGNSIGAFEIWNRELRLRRALGALAEVQALGRVGAIAWSENETTQVQIITRRLQAIQQQAQSQPTVDLTLLRSLGYAYQQVRSPQQAIEVYKQILALERQAQNTVAADNTLRTIAELHLSWFDYSQAAKSYEELRNLANTRGNRVSEVTYLQQLAYIYDRARQYQQAITVKQRLADLYLNEAQFTQVPALRLAIASDYQALGQTQQAFENYQEAYASAWSLRQYARAGDALRRLIVLYRSQGQFAEALQTSQILLEADNKAANFYGLMNTYDQIGQIHLQNGDENAALTAFEQGLAIAQQLQYQQPYFTQQIQQIQQQLAQ
ncbi:tetratricopeptide repeat protein [Gloeocapsopsis crepidinum LEGE 06123]|uniref:Tetratricopeptide repeat protein n=1 Tax=Gloeocapsopsis crepidinum LEGE 06123 TaxID=588587 RepID=A0ABR9UX56_9CHRO|nr:tetratricopeptide repeat protein [Gloeocapsopsis crepidinum]MBE9192145.1 tetratricopeptide repeat protein [Gloeocapsopsis crepidinum LEGE 06123]